MDNALFLYKKYHSFMNIIEVIQIRNFFIKLFIIAIILYSISSVAIAKEVPQNNKNNNPNIFEKAKEAGQEYKKQLEMKYYEELLKKNPKNVQVLEDYGKYLEENKYCDKAIKIYKTLIKLTKDNKYNANIKRSQAYKNYNEINKVFIGYIEQAKEYETNGQIEKANEYYLKAFNIFPDRYEAKFGLAKTYGWLKKFKESDKLYTELLIEAPNNISLLETYADQLQDDGKYEKAIGIYKKLLSLTNNKKYKTNIENITLVEKGQEQKKLVLSEDEKSFSKFIRQAKQYESTGKIREANEYYLKAEKISPGKYESSFGLAKTYGWLGKNQIAKSYYQKLLKVAPKNNELILAYNKFLKESTAKAISKQSTQFYNAPPAPDVAGEYLKQAQSFESHAQIAKANEYYKKAQKIDASRYEVKFGLARTYGWMHKDDLAMRYYNELLKQTPNNTSLLEFYADFQKSIKKYAEALNIYQKLLEQTKDNKYNLNIAEVYFLQKDYATSLKLYQDIYNQNPNSPEAQKNIAFLSFISGDFTKAIEFYEKYFSKKSDPDSVLIYSKCLFYTKQTQPAKKILESFLRQYPNNVDALSTLADIYISLRAPNEAIPLVDKAISLAPEDINLKIQAAKINIALKDYDTAKFILLALLKNEPKNLAILESLGDVSVYTDEFRKGLRFYESIENYQDNKRIKYKIAQAHHYNKEYVLSEALYKELMFDPEYSNRAKIGVAEIKIIRDKAIQAREILKEVLASEPDNVQAKKNMAIAWYTTGDNLTSIRILKKLPVDDPDINDINYNLAKAYNKIERNDIALDLLENIPQENARTLRKEILMLTRSAVEPVFDIYHMSGDANAGKFFRMGSNAYHYIRPNIRLIGTGTTTEYRNVTDLVGTRGTVIGGGIEGKLTDHLGFRSTAGYELFSNNSDNDIVLATALLKWYPNDVVSWTGGYIRSLDEIDSYMSAAGVVPSVGPFAGQLVGRIIDNKFVSNFAFKFPHKFYGYAGFSLGYKYGSNSPPNTYSEIPAGFGKVVYSGKESRAINQVLLGYDCYYTAYGVDRSGFGGANLLFNPVGSDGGKIEPGPGVPGVGGYFSPTFFLANKFPITIKGTFKESKLKYVVSAFWGLQTIQGQIGLLGFTDLKPGTIISYQYFGYSAGLRYNEKGKFSVALDYIFNNYMTVAQHLFKISLLYRF